ncbi:hypothetical protein BDB00DRAFT_956648 [Zychaea mexicana]|uniref:uncharacterized protein n=1 Tax=Zychaea mexicana TaxID=64656 RepID=UPI0022FE8B2F|nr:uncharacterized protein BDB00DRAFT_956648 [Zychaea mexicana]KAI9493644.1 hypothetical protein BDB00DRAFT_956648 [Zychaea mexicana]
METVGAFQLDFHFKTQKALCRLLLAISTHSSTTMSGNYYKQKYGNKRQKQASHQQASYQQQKQRFQDNNGVRTPGDLAHHLQQLDRQQYGAYKELLNYEYSLPGFTLIFDKVQSDPFAPPSRIRVLVKNDIAQFPDIYYSSNDRRVALSDYLTRELVSKIKVLRMDRRFNTSHWNDVKGGQFEIMQPGQQILDRTSIVIYQGHIEARFTFGLPARGRTITAQRAMDVLTGQLPDIVKYALKFTLLDQQDLKSFIESYEDQQWLRKQLAVQDLVAFVPDGAMLPRESGVSYKPLKTQNAVPFKSPESLKVDFACPSGKRVTGMGIRRGITMIAGGGYHGKSTLLEALEHGIYNHIPGDGREYLVCDPTLCKIRSEDGRSIEAVDISPYIDNLPFGVDSTSFSTKDASGSTSMAASIQEMVEIGAGTLLYDEDTCATNFMIRDQRMQRIIQKENEPITPLVYKIRSLYLEKGVSSILVIGGCGDYVDVANCVLEMRNYSPRDITEFAKEIASQYPSDLRQEGGTTYGNVAHRKLCIPEHTLGKQKVNSMSNISYDGQELVLSAASNLVDRGQTNWIVAAIPYLYKERSTIQFTLKDALYQLDSKIDADPTPHPNQMLRAPMDIVDLTVATGEYARPTVFQLAQAINRLRGLKAVSPLS